MPDAPAVVALGGGHGLAASLRALVQVTDRITAVVTVGDDGGSSGVLRRDLGVLPPGDLRMAMAALAPEDGDGELWGRTLQHRFDRGDLTGHAVGNLVLVALMEELGDPVAALEALGRTVRARGRVLPMCRQPVDLVAQLVAADRTPATVRGQATVAAAPGDVVSIALDPPEPLVCAEAVEAVLTADVVVLGPGSWFTSVLPHLLVPALRSALTATRGYRVVTLNLAPQAGETSGFTPENHLEVLAAHAPDLRIDLVVVDPATVADERLLRSVADGLGADLLLAPVADPSDPGQHRPEALASAYAEAFSRGRIRPWR